MCKNYNNAMFVYMRGNLFLIRFDVCPVMQKNERGEQKVTQNDPAMQIVLHGNSQQRYSQQISDYIALIAT